MTATTVAHTTTADSCSGCGLPIREQTDIRTGLDQACRSQFNYRKISSLSDEARSEVNTIIHKLAGDVVSDDTRGLLFRLHELGFEALSQRIERRLSRRIRIEVDVTSQTNGATTLVPNPPTRPQIDLPFKLTDGQEKAREMVWRLRQKLTGVAVIAGFAGTGKTSLLRVLALEHGTPAVITPTGKAALRVTEATGLQASTIHRWMYKPMEDPQTGATKYVRKTWEDIELGIPPSRLVLLDEASMVNPEVWEDIRQVVQQHDIRLVCVGDSFQLPPVQKEGAPPFSILTADFAEKIGAERVEMTEVLRQAQDSPIIRASMGLRNRLGRGALRDLKEIRATELSTVCPATHRAGGVTICHRNVTRFNLNFAIRQTLGFNTEMPQPGEPLMVLKNSYDTGVVNGETISFPGWKVEPNEWSRVFDRYKDTNENARFGGVALNEKINATLCLEEMHGRLTGGFRAISDAGTKWARLENFYSGDKPAPHVHAHFGYGYTAHKCVHPDTLVETAYGLERIRDIKPEGWIATAAGHRKYQSLVTNPSAKMLRVATKDGYTVDVTPDHRLFVWNGAEYALVEAQHILPGAFVRLALGDQFDPPERPPRLPPAPKTDVRSEQYRFPELLTPDVAELLGLLVADGTVTARGTIRLAKRHEDVVNRFVALLQSVFGLEAKVTPRYNGTRALCAEAHSKQVTDWLRHIGGVEPNDKFVPPTILRARLSEQARFLRGLFEDGTVNIRRGVAYHVEWSNRSEAVASTVQTMLLRFGIISGRRTRTTREHEQTMLYIYGENAKRFGRAIGFVSQWKNDRISMPVGRETRYVAPFSLAEKQAVWSALRESEKNNLRASGTMSRDRMSAVSAREAACAVSGLLSQKLSWHHTRVATVMPVEDAPSMCVEVPDGARFLQNGFDGSNSQGSQWPYVLVVFEPHIRLNEDDGARWAYTAITRAQIACAVLFERIW